MYRLLHYWIEPDVTIDLTARCQSFVSIVAVMLGMQWNKGVCIDTCLPFSLCLAPKLFNILADLLVWIANQHNVSFLIHYLDDFLTMGPPSSPTCQHNLDTLVQICNYLGVPLALEKVEGPSISLPFFGHHVRYHQNGS